MKKKIFAISGSTRQHSSNLTLLHAIAELFPDQLDITIFNGIATIPHFNPDWNEDDLPKEVAYFREQIDIADGVLICTPEYAHGVPGSLKNAIDWTVSSNNFSKKATCLITASTDGRNGHAALLETLRTIEARNVDQLQLVIQFIRTKMDTDNKIKDQKTLSDILELINKLIATIDQPINE